MFFNTNIQHNIAQLSRIATEQDKSKKLGTEQQEKIQRSINTSTIRERETVSPAGQDTDSQKVDEDTTQQNMQPDDHQENNPREASEDGATEHTFTDENKGRIIDITC